MTSTLLCIHLSIGIAFYINLDLDFFVCAQSHYSLGCLEILRSKLSLSYNNRSADFQSVSCRTYAQFEIPF